MPFTFVGFVWFADSGTGFFLISLKSLCQMGSDYASTPSFLSLYRPVTLPIYPFDVSPQTSVACPSIVIFLVSWCFSFFHI